MTLDRCLQRTRRRMWLANRSFALLLVSFATDRSECQGQANQGRAATAQDGKKSNPAQRNASVKHEASRSLASHLQCLIVSTFFPSLCLRCCCFLFSRPQSSGGALHADSRVAAGSVSATHGLRSSLLCGCEGGIWQRDGLQRLVASARVARAAQEGQHTTDTSVAVSHASLDRLVVAHTFVMSARSVCLFSIC